MSWHHSSEKLNCILESRLWLVARPVSNSDQLYVSLESEGSNLSLLFCLHYNLGLTGILPLFTEILFSSLFITLICLSCMNLSNPLFLVQDFIQRLFLIPESFKSW